MVTTVTTATMLSHGLAASEEVLLVETAAGLETAFLLFAVGQMEEGMRKNKDRLLISGLDR